MTDHPILHEFRKVFVDKFGQVPTIEKFEVQDDPDADVMEVEIKAWKGGEYIHLAFKATQQGDLTEEKWGEMMRRVIRECLEMCIKRKNVYTRKAKRKAVRK